MGVTDTYKWLRAIVYNILMGHVTHVEVRNRRRYILLIAFRLAIGRGGRDLRR